jgi:uncharacterized LabA/DUF88 family protein/cold shock CspA family protein
MLKAGIFLDIENLSRNGGWGMRYQVVKQLVQAQGAVVLRANAYMAADLDREKDDPDLRRRSEEFRNAVRRTGYHLVIKPVHRYTDEAGVTVLKANADMELAVDALLQADNLDYILLGTGDGDFIRLVRALQNRGKRVDVLGFGNVSFALKREVDFFFSGFMVPQLLPASNNPDGSERHRGVMYSVLEDKGYGFLQKRTGMGIDDFQFDIFCHICDFKYRIDNESFAKLKTYERVLEFDMVRQADGRYKATNVEELDWQGRRRRAAGDGNDNDTSLSRNGLSGKQRPDDDGNDAPPGNILSADDLSDSDDDEPNGNRL